MGLTIISETVSEMCKVAHSFSDGEKEFVVQFAFKSGDKTLTNQLIDELSQCEDGQESQSIMEQYAKMIDMKPMWVSQIENLLVSIEMYRIEEEKAINRLAEVLTAYGVDVTEEQVRRADAEEIKEKVNESRREQEEEDEEPYVHQIDADSHLIGPPFEILSQKAVEHYMKLQKKGENIYIDTLTYDEFMLLGDLEMIRRFTELEEESEKAKLNRMQDNELEYVQEQTEAEHKEKEDKTKDSDWEDNIANRMIHWSYTAEQKMVLTNAMEAKIPKAVILSFFYPENSAEEMSKVCRQYIEEH